MGQGSTPHRVSRTDVAESKEDRQRARRIGAAIAAGSLIVLLGCLLRLEGGLTGLSPSQQSLAIVALVLSLALIAWVLRGRPHMKASPEGAQEHARSTRVAASVAAGVLPLATAAVLLTVTDFEPLCARGLIYVITVVVEAVLLSLAAPGLRSGTVAGLALLAPAVVWKVASFVPSLSTSPFSLGWSEASRYYYASLFDSTASYGFKTAWPVLHPSRYLLQAVPFFLGDLPIAAHRLWQAALWIGMTVAVAAALARRWAGEARWRTPLFVGWAFLFLFQGPVYYHLALGALPVLIGFRWDRPWRNLGLVLLGSAWAGLSRVNWYPVPALLACVLLAIEQPAEQRDGWTPRDLRWPALWVLLGGLTALLVGAAYARLSGNSLDQFSSSLTSDLLWYRLLPSATYPLGVLPAIFIAALPAMLLILISPRPTQGPDWMRILLVGATLAVLLLGGLFVSAKIGGGGDLHNLDAFLLLLLVVAGGLWARWPEGGTSTARDIRLLLAVLALLVPAGFAVASGAKLERVDLSGQRAAISLLRERLEGAEGPVLFLTQRHLLTFGELALPLVEPYEKVHLMEMAMSRNPSYLGQFRRDLEEQRFAWVVSDTLNPNPQGPQHAFGEENDAWLEAVVVPLLDSYQVEERLSDVGIWLLAPKGDE
jgi:hypothetical protein